MHRWDGKQEGKREGKPQSQRQLKVGEELRHALALVIERGELRDPDLAGISITVTEVRVSPDLRNAAFYVLPLGGGDTKTVVEALTRAGPYLRRRLASAVKLRYAPNISFRADLSFDEASHIDSLLKNPSVKRDLPGGGGNDHES